MKRIILFSFASVLLTACSGIPVSAPIKYGQEINTKQSDQFIQVIGRPPTVGMNQVEIVKGFLTALADSRDNYGIARQYLLPTTAATWRSESSVTIYESASLEVTASGDTATANLAKAGEIDPSGYLTVASKGTQIAQNFGLEKDSNGQWRINKLTDGVLLTSGDIERSFNGYPTYFLSPNQQKLVPDTVLLPQTVTGSATSLVKALLAGPSPKLALAVVNAFPTGTQLTYGSVPVVNGVATVDLTNQILSADQATRTLLSAQLFWTLSSLPNVSAIEIKVSGQPVTVTGVGTRQSAKDWAKFNPTQFLGSELVHFVKDNKVYALGLDGSKTPVVQVDPNARINLGNTFGAIEGGSIAAVTTDGKKVLVSTGRGGQFSPVGSGDSISKPTWDKSGSIFYADYGNGIFEINSKRQLLSVSFDSSNFANVNQVKQITVAQDGTRVALVVSDGSTDVLLVGALIRTGASSRITGIHLVERSITSIQDFAWQTPTSLVVLGSDVSGGSLVFDVDITSGSTSSSSAPLSAQTIATSIGKQIYVGTVSGSKLMIAKQSGTVWIDLIEGTSPYLAN